MASETGDPVAPSEQAAPALAPRVAPESSTGVVRPREEQTADGVLDPAFWSGLDVQTQGDVAEALPDMPQSDAEYQAQIEDTGTTGPDAPAISALTANPDGTVTWTTDKDATTELEYGTAAGAYDQRAPTDGSYATDHTVALTGLTAATTYYVRVASRDADGNLSTQETQFTTL